MTQPPRIYFAGKISSRDWRNSIVKSDRAGSVDDVERDLFNPDYVIDYESFLYGGPFFVSCDHGCFHGSNGHGVKNGGCGGGHELDGITPAELHKRIFDINFERLKRADIVFAYINERDCFGTLIEIGHAQSMEKSIVVLFGPKVKPDQFWMACERAQVLRGEPRHLWPMVLTWITAKGASELKRTSALRRIS
jgi:hypothetical protein